MARPAVVCAIVTWLALAVGLVHGQDRVATISGFSGTVQVGRAGEWQQVMQVGPTIRHNSIFPKDEIKTGPDGNAEILFEDGSIVKVSPNSSLVVDQGPLALDKAATTGKSLRRSIRVLVGKAWADIKPSTVVATEFEMPEVVAAIRGSVLSFDVPPEGGPYLFSASAETGGMDITHVGPTGARGTGMAFGVSAGQGIQGGKGSFTVELAPGTVGEVVGRAPDGTQVVMDGQDKISVTRAAGGAKITNVGPTSVTVITVKGLIKVLGPGQSFFAGGAYSVAAPKAWAVAGAAGAGGAVVVVAAPGVVGAGGGGGGSKRVAPEEPPAPEECEPISY